MSPATEIEPAEKPDNAKPPTKLAKKVAQQGDTAAQDDTNKPDSADSLDEEMDDDDASGDDPKNDAEREKRTIFVGNVPKGTDRKRILKLFKPFGKVETVRLRNLVPLNPNIGRRKAFLSKQLSPHVDSISAYVVFAAAPNLDEQIDKACNDVNMTLLDEKHLRVSRATDNTGSSKRHSAFVGNLPFDCQEEELIQAFLPVAEKVGAKLVNARVNRDKDTGVCRGVGFVSFDDEVAVQACINQSGELKVRKNKLRISKATKQKNRNTKTYKWGKKGANFKHGMKKNDSQKNRLPAKKPSFKSDRKPKGGKKG